MKSPITGECDACPRVDVPLKQVPGSTLKLCDTCHAAEVAVIEETKRVNAVITTSQAQDQTITRSADIFNANVVAFVELHAQIMGNNGQQALFEDAPNTENAKLEKFVQTVEERIKHLNAVIFEKDLEVTAMKNERAAWTTQIKDFMNKLRADQRERFKKFDISYSPTPITTREKKVATSKKPATFNMNSARAMAQKYNVPMAGIQSLVVSRNISYESAAQQLADMMGIPHPKS